MLIITKRKKERKRIQQLLSSSQVEFKKKIGKKWKLFHISIICVQLLNQCISYPNHAQLIMKIKYIWEVSGLCFSMLELRSCHSILISKKLNRLKNHLFLDPSERKTQGKPGLERQENTGNRCLQELSFMSRIPVGTSVGWKPQTVTGELLEPQCEPDRVKNCWGSGGKDSTFTPRLHQALTADTGEKSFVLLEGGGVNKLFLKYARHFGLPNKTALRGNPLTKA